MDDYIKLFCENTNVDCRKEFGRYLFGDRLDLPEKDTDTEIDVWDLLVSFLGGTFMGGDNIAKKVKSGRVFEEFKKLKSCEDSFINKDALAERVPVLYRGTTFDPDVIINGEGWEKRSDGDLRAALRRLLNKVQKGLFGGNADFFVEGFRPNMIQTDYIYEAGSPIQSWTADPAIAAEFSRFQTSPISKILSPIKRTGELKDTTSNAEFRDYVIRLNKELGQPDGDFKFLTLVLHQLSTLTTRLPKAVMVWENPDVDQLLFNVDFIHQVIDKAALGFGQESEVIRISKEPIKVKLVIPHEFFKIRRIIHNLWGDMENAEYVISKLLGQASGIKRVAGAKKKPKPETHTF